MFTGIVEEVGILKKIVWGAHSAALTIQAKRSAFRCRGGRQHCGKRDLPDGHQPGNNSFYGRCDA